MFVAFRFFVLRCEELLHQEKWWSAFVHWLCGRGVEEVWRRLVAHQVPALLHCFARKYARLIWFLHLTFALLASDSMEKLATFLPCTFSHTTTPGQASTASTTRSIPPPWTCQPWRISRFHPASQGGTPRDNPAWTPVFLHVSTKPSRWMSSQSPGCRRRRKPPHPTVAFAAWAASATSPCSPTFHPAAIPPQAWEKRRKGTHLACRRTARVRVKPPPIVEAPTALGLTSPPGLEFLPDPRRRRSSRAAPPWHARRLWPPRPGFRSNQSPFTAAKPRKSDELETLLYFWKPFESVHNQLYLHRHWLIDWLIENRPRDWSQAERSSLNQCWEMFLFFKHRLAFRVFMM